MLGAPRLNCLVNRRGVKGAIGVMGNRQDCGVGTEGIAVSGACSGSNARSVPYTPHFSSRTVAQASTHCSKSDLD